MATLQGHHVPFGDEFKFVKQVVELDLARHKCKLLLNIARRRVRSLEYRGRFDDLLQSYAGNSEPE